MATIIRQFGIKVDAEAAVGGSSFDLLAGTAPPYTVPDADTWFPVTGATLDKGIDRINFDNEARGRRARTPARPFRSAPQMVVQMHCYHSIAKLLLKRCLGGPETVTSAVPATPPYTHALRALDYGDDTIWLPTMHCQRALDDLNQKMSGASINRVTFDFPFDGDGTIEAEFHGLYQKAYSSAVPTATFTGLSPDTLMIRDAVVHIDGSVDPIPDLQGFRFAFVNNLTMKPFAGQNIEVVTVGTPTQTQKVWWPSYNKIGPAQDVTFGLVFGRTNTAQEFAQSYSQVEKIVVEISGAPLAEVGAVELLRFTIFNGMFTDGGAPGLTARDDVVSDFNGTAFYSEADGKDVLIEVVDDSAVLA